MLNKRVAGMTLALGDNVSCEKRELVCWISWGVLVVAGRARLHRKAEAILARGDVLYWSLFWLSFKFLVGLRRVKGAKDCTGIERWRNWAISRRRRRPKVSSFVELSTAFEVPKFLGLTLTQQTGVVTTSLHHFVSASVLATYTTRMRTWKCNRIEPT